MISIVLRCNCLAAAAIWEAMTRSSEPGRTIVRWLRGCLGIRLIKRGLSLVGHFPGWLLAAVFMSMGYLAFFGVLKPENAGIDPFYLIKPFSKIPDIPSKALF